MRYIFMALIILLSSCENDQQKTINYTSGDFPQEVYVWQRVWTPEVISAVKTRAVEFDKTTLLAAEITYSSGLWSCQHFSAPLRWTEQNSQEYGFAFRINSKAATTQWGNSDFLKVIEYIRPYVSSTRVIQLDYDCPSLKLKDYVKLLKNITLAFPNLSLEITCLPDWLNYPEFAELIQHTDRYIMQVHGVSGHGKGMALCNADDAYKVAIECAEYGIPYLLALPTYRHAVSYADDGKIAQVASEGSYQKSHYELATANPVELSLLIDRWKKKRPELMQGVIWYRLPVSTDRMNWTWETLERVKAGEFEKLANPELQFLLDNNGLYQLFLSNSSEQHIDYPENISISWKGMSFCIAHESSNYSSKNFERSQGVSMKWKGSTPYPLAPGERVSCGWFRFAETIDPNQITTMITP